LRSIRCGRSRCPTNWLLGWTIGLWVDELDHVWVIHRGAGGLHNNERGAELSPPIAECCRTGPAHPGLRFGRHLLRTWGGPGPGYEWPQSNHGIHVDYKGNVWIGGNGEKDAHILKFTNDASSSCRSAISAATRTTRRDFGPRRQDLGSIRKARAYIATAISTSALR